MAFFVVFLIALNVVLGISVAYAVYRHGGDGPEHRLLGISEPRGSSAVKARNQRMEADEHAWRFDD